MTKTFAFAAAALAAFAAPVAAKEVPTASVSIADLDLSTAADQDRLHQRIATTARRICTVGSRSIASRRVDEACRLAVMADAAPKIAYAVEQAREKRFATNTLDLQG